MRMVRLNTVPCPIDGCTGRRKRNQVLCVTHWFQVPQALRERIWSLYRTAPGSPDHLRALAEAKRIVNDKQQPAPSSPAA